MFHKLILSFDEELLFTTESRLLTTQGKRRFESIVGKGENAVKQHFSAFPTMFPSLSNRDIIILVAFELFSANAFNLVQSKIL